MKWYNNFRNIKFVLIAVAALIALVSLYVSNTLVNELKREEVKKVELWAEAMRSLNCVEEVETISLEDINASGGNVVLGGGKSSATTTVRSFSSTRSPRAICASTRAIPSWSPWS